MSLAPLLAPPLSGLSLPKEENELFYSYILFPVTDSQKVRGGETHPGSDAVQQVYVGTAISHVDNEAGYA